MILDQEVVASFVLDCAAQMTGQDRQSLHGETHLAEIGIDSLFAVLICGKLEDRFGLEIEPILMFEHRTANEVAAALALMASET